jgi:uncharacterized protein
MPSPLDLWLMVALGFLGSFGHCVGMCGPVTAAFALSRPALAKVPSQPSSEEPATLSQRAQADSLKIDSLKTDLSKTDSLKTESLRADAIDPDSTESFESADDNFLASDLTQPSDEPAAVVGQGWAADLQFHLWLNAGRLLSYALVGVAIGGIGSVLLAGGQVAGVGSALRRFISIATGLLLIWFGLSQAKPGFLPSLPFLHPVRQQRLHERLNRLMMRVSLNSPMATPLLLGLLWGFIPCGFLYAGQLRAAQTQSWLGGGAIMLAFGLGTLPAMLVTGVTTSRLSQDRRSQLFRLGGVLTMVMGALLLLRTGDAMRDYSGSGAIICLVLALVARPVSRLWAGPLRYRRLLGVGAFALSLLHALHMVSHAWHWQWQAVAFMLRQQQWGVWLGIVSLLLMVPAALTSFDRAQRALGNRWRSLHLLGVPALLLAVAHTLLLGARYWGAVTVGWPQHLRAVGLLTVVGGVMAVRSPQVWSLLSLRKYYASAKSNPTAALQNPAHASAPSPAGPSEQQPAHQAAHQAAHQSKSSCHTE